ncbi:MAG: class I SAM-dependent methyltransferase [Cyanobacteria bacterium SZAS LIN-2]|nr:class I SAM-dependent methyltransferase [Cyanobacteria bacterium SZAS LIN-3]MBS1997288.1 class I SAM-dependent methyltransferase [Cyanobacteria bacterium SZAS LIN-2]MBS2005967.1 class I SAM-dependent methyltransferase [Cyanobacteria bacterium SZAS TMP-1]
MSKLSAKSVKVWHRMARKSFYLWERLGLHVVPNHFYQPIPDTRELTEALFARQTDLVGVDMRDAQQCQLLATVAAAYKAEYDALPRDRGTVPHQFYLNNGTYQSVDAEMLYSMVRHFKPRKLIEIGSGFSTYLAAQAVLKNESSDGVKCVMTAIEPYPNPVLAGGFPGMTRLVRDKVQTAALSEFEALEENDILFIDSSHVLKIGSDVQYEYLEILPRLKKGVIIHIHDIFLPAEYPREWVFKHQRFWNEQYLLQAFLTCNDSFEVLFGGSYMHLKHPDKLASAFASYDRETVWPGNFWMRRVK